ncbi:MAG: rRNA maturation RNase YbeY [Candidatus Harrisonbacteria bacterium CG10_big_fil_rev_8_21_14_0_10_42_17]|uniref:rRNA maturation RNase YbeY n=1 Tax=Candidatus Harrisonbacteria bacterium CG10_big_fil_rev_8_21_14_0_10_42_17 TaxID=1974584 RepID=A0A2M6WIG9_9BACT|nr:MAG: rRNA maturation RNase YbeY [Candidatus Harrisonbacteria bacterium CG10_big_fil_rev_8_21_14_0_10_42_17]
MSRSVKGVVRIGGFKKFQHFEQDIRRAFSSLSAYLGHREWSVDIILVGDQAMKKNVLSFQADFSFPRPDIRGTYLGELYLNPDYITRHGESLRHMLIHGFLHLLGYRHDTRRDRISMEKKEQELIVHLGSLLQD